MAKVTGSTVQWYHADRQGSLFTVSDGAGARSGATAYSPYGEMSSASPPGGGPFGYTGRYYDQETGLMQYRARYYSPRLGQFLQIDPIGMKDDANLYLYVANDPVNATDPTGEIAFPLAVAACAANPACRGAAGAVAGAVVGGGARLLREATDGKPGVDVGAVVKDGAKAGVVGGVSAATLNTGAAVATGAAVEAADRGLTSASKGEHPTIVVSETARRGVEGAVTTAAGAGVGKVVSKVAFPTQEVTGTVVGAAAAGPVSDTVQKGIDEQERGLPR